MEPRHGQSRVNWLGENGLAPYTIADDRNLYWSEYEGQIGRWIRVVWVGQRAFHGEPEDTEEQIKARYREAELQRMKKWMLQEGRKTPFVPMFPLSLPLPPPPGRMFPLVPRPLFHLSYPRKPYTGPI